MPANSPQNGNPPAPEPEDTPDLFFDAEIVVSYTREDALEDGTLVDVSETAKEAGFRFPVAVTATVWENLNAIPDKLQGIEDIKGRLWDLLYMGRMAIAQSKEDGSILLYTFILHTEDLPTDEADLEDYNEQSHFRVKLVVGPGDNLEPVITIMLPDED